MIKSRVVTILLCAVFCGGCASFGPLNNPDAGATDFVTAADQHTVYRALIETLKSLGYRVDVQGNARIKGAYMNPVFQDDTIFVDIVLFRREGETTIRCSFVQPPGGQPLRLFGYYKACEKNIFFDLSRRLKNKGYEVRCAKGE